MTRMLTRAPLGPELREEVTHVEGVIVLIAGVSFIAGVIHVAASVDHYREFALYSAVFALLAAFQLAWGVALTRRSSRRLLIVGAVINVGVIGMWAASRTVGVPIAPQPWVPEAVGAADLMATVAEIMIVIGTTCLLTSPRSPLAQRVLERLAPVLLVVTFLCVTFGVGAGHAG